MALTSAIPQSYTWRDAKGQTARTRFFVLYDGAGFADAESAAGGVRAATAAMTNAALQGGNGPDGETLLPSYGAQAVYEDVEDKAVMTFLDDKGNVHRYQIPAPKTAIFTADGQTVDSGNALVIAYVAAMKATTGVAAIGSRSLRQLTVFVGGVRQRRKNIRKMTIFTLSAKLDEPAE